MTLNKLINKGALCYYSKTFNIECEMPNDFTLIFSVVDNTTKETLETIEIEKGTEDLDQFGERADSLFEDLKTKHIFDINNQITKP